MATPSIEGTYRLVRRELPDGTVQYPPVLKGIITWTLEFRNFSIVWTDDKGKFYSECYVARYALTDKEYTETQEYLIFDNQVEGKGISYDLSIATAKSQVSMDGNRIRFALPQPFEQALSITVEFDGAKLTATSKDLFVDYWDKVS